MTQPDLERAVARATGEDRQLIRRMGFSFVTVPRPRRRRRQRRRNAAKVHFRPAPVLQPA